MKKLSLKKHMAPIRPNLKFKPVIVDVWGPTAEQVGPRSVIREIDGYPLIVLGKIEYHHKLVKLPGW